MQRKGRVLLTVAIIACTVLTLVSVFFAILQTVQLRTAEAERESYRALLEENKQRGDELQQELTDMENRLQNAEDEQKRLQQELENAQAAQEELRRENGLLKQQVALKQSQGTPNTGKICYLTFDDGPSANVTPRILDTLKTYGVQATFFVIGTGKQEYITRAANEGHAIGLHCGQHVYANIYASENAYWNDLSVISDIVKNCTGQESFLVRFPGGSSNTVSAAYTKGIMSTLTKALPEKGYAYFDWNVDSGDAAGSRSAATITNNVLNGAKGKQQICVLMHDASGKSTTAEALPAMIEGLRNQGFSFAPLSTAVTGFRHRVSN